MIIDIGGGSTEVAVISLGGVVLHRSTRVAGTKLDEVIANYIRKRYGLMIGERTAEIIKLTIGDAMPSFADSAASAGKFDGKVESTKSKDELSHKGKDGRPTIHRVEVRGRDAVSGLPRVIEVTAGEITNAMMPVINQMVGAVKAVLEETPPELAADIIDKGIVMAGGTSTLRNLDRLMTQETGVPCHVAEDALLCVVRGTGIAVENIELYRKSLNRQ
jgi:rod shape-determining protein MreB